MKRKLSQVTKCIMPAALVLMLVPAMAFGQWNSPANLGPGVNTAADEMGLCDFGGYLYFTSSRPGGAGGYDMYRAENVGGEWVSPVNLALLNTAANERAPTIQCIDGNPRMIYASDFNGTYDLWGSENTEACPDAPVGSWDTPATEVATGDTDTMPWMSADGLTLLFGSDQAGGEGGFDIWMSTRALPSDPWGTPTNLGPVINTVDDERGPSISPDGQRLYFASNRPGGLGGADIYVSTNDGARGWLPPVNLTDINSDADDTCPTESEDGSQLLFGSTRTGGYGAKDLYSATRPDAVPTVSEWGLIIMTLLLLTAGTIVFARRRRPAAA
ncbi:MAG: IPTL-CTERM sorting domain-containing protein [Planctomycetota bacterium]